MDPDEFEAVKSEFEDPTAAVRLLLATDAASEGINMQEECRWVIHYDIPWSPSKIQSSATGVFPATARSVMSSVHYFRCERGRGPGLPLLRRLEGQQIQEDLGSVERVFDAAIQRHFEGKKISAGPDSTWPSSSRSKTSPERADLGRSSVGRHRRPDAAEPRSCWKAPTPGWAFRPRPSWTSCERPSPSRGKDRWKRSLIEPASTA